MFELKKILGHLLMPLPLGLGLFSLGLLVFVFFQRGRRLLLIAWLVFAVASNRGVSIALTRSLENDHPPVPPLALPGSPWPDDLRAVAFVVVLGGGHGDAAALSAGQRLSASARARLIEGVRIALALPNTWLVVSGPRNPPADPFATPTPSHARVLADAAVELGFPRDRIVEIDSARDTAEEAEALRRLVGEEPVALVTSAWHLPRALRLVEVNGVRAVPCPADFLGQRDAQITASDWFAWDGEALMNTTRAWREYLGRVWAAFTQPTQAR